MVELSPRERAILTFEREWWKHAEAKDTAARARLGLSPEDYYRALGAIIDHPEPWPTTRCSSAGCAASGWPASGSAKPSGWVA